MLLHYMSRYAISSCLTIKKESGLMFQVMSDIAIVEVMFVHVHVGLFNRQVIINFC
jgi:hypothetical protein